MKTSPTASENLVPLGRVAKFIRQLTHDVRNGLSAIDLESAYIAELVTDPEAVEEVRKLRSMVSNTARSLKDLSQFFQPVTVHTMPWQVETVCRELQSRVQTLFPEESETLEVDCAAGLVMVEIDLDQMLGVVLEVLRNAFQFRTDEARVLLSCFAKGKRVVLEVRESKPGFESQVPPEKWGSEPLITTRHGGYGLGLFHARQVMEAQGGELETRYHDGVLFTRMGMPICA